MGGVGKTELAVQYALMHDGDYPAGIWWLSGGDVVGQVLSYGIRMGLPMTGTDSTAVQKVQECYDFWRQGLEGRRLVIVDDVTTVEDYEAVLPYLPADPSFRILITTRERLQIKRLDLGVLSEGEAIEFLTQLLGSERVAAEGQLVKELCGWLGCLPLGLELVGRYLVSKPRTSIATVLERLTDSRLGARALLRGQPMTSTHVSLAAAFEVSWVALVEQPRTQELAAFVSLFGLAAIPQDILTSCFEPWEEDLEDAWGRLMNLHLVGQDEKLHSLLREFLTVKLDERLDCGEMRRRYAGTIVASAEKHCKQTMNRDEVQTAKVYETHWLDFNQRQSEENFGISIASVCIRLNLYYSSQGLFGLALEPIERALAIYEKQLCLDHPSTVTCLNNLAGLYRSMGCYAEAEPLFQRSLAIHEKQLGPDHPFTGTCLNNLAELYRSMGRYAEAEPLFQRGLAISEKQLGSDHPFTGTCLNNLAGLYRSMGYYAEAEPLFQRSLAISEKQLGPDHPDTGGRMNNLAELYRSMGRDSEAEPLFQRALAIHEKQLGPDHLSTGTCLNNLALLYESMGHYSEAEPLFQRALAISEKQLGPDHPSTGMSLNNLALLYDYMGRYAEAEPLFQRALAIGLNGLGEDHPDVAVWYNNIAGFYTQQQRYPEAEAFYLKALGVFINSLPEGHPHIEGTFNGLVDLIATAHKTQNTQDLSDHPITQNILQQVEAMD
jgi:tetratricopeptide (TPR) repeat protein